MRVGYARTSTTHQDAGLEAQIKTLKLLGCDRIFSEQVSSVNEVRKELEAAIDFVRDGDILTVTKLDRLARSTVELMKIEQRLNTKKVALTVLDPMLETSTPMGRMVFTFIGAIAQFEREVMLERQRDGLAKAKAEGRCKGRVPTAFEKADKVREMIMNGDKPQDIAGTLDISRASVYRIMNATPEHAEIMRTRVADLRKAKVNNGKAASK